jgi:hypothetical protein
MAHTTSFVAPHSLFKKLILEPPLIKHIPLALLHHKQDHRVVLAIPLPALGETRRDLPERLVGGISIEVGEVRRGAKVLVGLLGEVSGAGSALARDAVSRLHVWRGSTRHAIASHRHREDGECR